MNIRIDDDVPMPQPDKPDTWVTGPKAELIDPPTCPVCDFGHFFGHCTQCGYREESPSCEVPKTCKAKYAGKANFGGSPQRYPAETTYDAKGVPTVDCFLVGGPLNGRHGPVVGTLNTVELEVYAADGSVQSVELYELGAKGDLGGRYWAGTKGKQQCSLCKDWFAIGIVNDNGYCAECWSQIKT